MMLRLPCMWVVLSLAFGIAPFDAEAAAASAKVNFLQGIAEVLPGAAQHRDGHRYRAGAPWKRLRKGSKISVGDAVRTLDKTRLELKVPDGSKVRLGARSELVLEESHFGTGEQRKVTFTLWLGRVWAKVAKRVGGNSSFEVKTHNAVAGVRGTSFTVIARADLSSLVKVYAGSVGVKKKTALLSPVGRRQVAGPERIDKKQWEEVIATAMRQIQITSLGQIQPAEDFLDEGEDLQWAMWNQDRDDAVR